MMAMTWLPVVLGSLRIKGDNVTEHMLFPTKKTYFLYIRFGMDRAIKLSDIALGGATQVVP